MLFSKPPVPERNPKFGCDSGLEHAHQTDVGLARKGVGTPVPGAKLCGKPVLRILCRATGETVGFLYEWNTGERQPMWKAGRVRNVEYAPMTSDPAPSGS